MSKVSAAVVGEDLYVVRVSVSPLGVRVRRGPVLRGFRRMGVEEARRGLAGLGGGGGVTLVLGSGVCGVRPMQLGVSRWGAARGEVVRSIGRLFPLEPEEAVVGLIERSPGGGGGDGEGSGERGYLVVAPRWEVESWTGALERAVGREVGEVLSPQMAMLGLGLQHEERVGVIERSASGGEEIHWLRYGEVEELGASWSSEMDDTASVSGATLRRLPGAGGEGERDGVEAVDGYAVAVGGALAGVVAGGRFAPLDGRATRAPRRWVAPIVATAAAALLLWAGGVVLEGRYERGIERLEREAAGLEGELGRVQAMRAELTEKTALMEEGVGEVVAGWRSVMPDLAAAHEVIPAEGFLYEVSVDGERVYLRGEAPRASDVLRAMEASAAFDEPSRRSPPTQVEERSNETFDLAARRAGASAGESAGDGGEGGAVR